MSGWDALPEGIEPLSIRRGIGPESNGECIVCSCGGDFTTMVAAGLRATFLRSPRSPLVRLKPGTWPITSRSRHSFNPPLVRLRPCRLYRVGAYSSKFQSSAGSIEAKELQAVFLCCHGFNPTLVRLRPRSGDGTDALPPQFQSHAGSIEARLAPHHSLRRASFNPTLVRLRRISSI